MQHLRLRSNHSNRKNLMPLCHCVTVCLYVCMSNRTLVSHICMVQTLCLDRAKAMFGWLKCPRSRT